VNATLALLFKRDRFGPYCPFNPCQPRIDIRLAGKHASLAIAVLALRLLKKKKKWE
jgi:hypothetical protein